MCEVTPTGSGEVSRDEFVAHVWMLLRASEEQRQRFAFAKLDVNRSGALERSDLVASMRRQLSIARTLSPLLVQLQLRRHALTEPSPSPLRDLSETSPRPLDLSCRHTLTAAEQRQLGETAVAAAHETIDAMHSQVATAPSLSC